ncbi:MAG: tetratricopeptide repeat protein [Coriobacteriales bacterium]|nr:tetratricopeptide repeat protein [Coriobacteriales bacterium]
MDENLDLKELNEQGRVYFSADQYDNAIACYQKALALDGQERQTYYNLVEAYVMKDEYAKARDVIRKALALDADDGEAYYHLGNIDFLEGDYGGGRENYAKAFNRGLDTAQMHVNLASLEEEKGDVPEAIRYYDKAIVRDRFMSYARIRKTELLMSLNENEAALKAIEGLVEIQPEIFEGHHYKYLILDHLGRAAEAEKALDFALTMFPDDEGLIFDKVRLLDGQGHYEQALGLLDQLDAVPKEVAALEKGRLLLGLERISEAEAVLKEQNAEEPNGGIMLLLVMTGIAREDFEQAFRYSEEIIDLSTSSEEYDLNYFSALYYKGFALKQTGDVAEAKAAFEAAAKELQMACSVNAGLLDLYLLRAMAYLELEDNERALEMVQYVLNLNDNIGEAHFIRAQIYDAAGEVKKAEADRALAYQLSDLLTQLKAAAVVPKGKAPRGEAD